MSMLASLADGALPWEQIGPSGGDRFMVKLSPTNPATVYVLGYNAVHRSINKGDTWTPIHSQIMARNSFADMAFLSTTGSLIVASSLDGVWYSGNDGASWQERSAGLPSLNGNGTYFPVASVAALSSGRIFASFGSHRTAGMPPYLIYSSDDSGLTWTPRDQGIATVNTNVYTFTVSLLSTDVARTQLWAMVYGAGVFAYSNGVWASRQGNLPPEALRTTFLAHDRQDSRHLVLGTEDAWIFETRNAGQTWSAVPRPPQLGGLARLPLVYAVAIDPNNGGVILVRAMDRQGGQEFPLFRPGAGQDGGAGFYVTANGGATWTQGSMFAFRMEADPSEVVEDVIPNLGLVRRSKTWYRTSGGRNCLLRSTNGLLSFEVKTDGVETTWVNSVKVLPTPPQGLSNLVLAASEDGLYLLSNGLAGGWSFASSADSPVYTWSFAADYQNSRKVLYAVGSPAWSTPQYRGIYRMDLDCFNSPCPPADNQILSDTGVWHVVTTPANPNLIYAGCQTAGVLRSTTGGATWTAFNAGIALPASITDVLLDTNGAPLYASFRTSNGDSSDPTQPSAPQEGEAGGVYRYNAGNSRWERLNGLSLAAYDLDLMAGPTQAVLAATAAGVYKYTAGQGWTLLSEARLTNELKIDSQNPNSIYAATQVGIFRTTDGGAHWQDLSAGLDSRAVYSLDQDKVTGTLYAGTEGSSVFALRRDPNPVPVIGPSVTSLAFGPFPLGYTRTVMVTVTNRGEADLVLTNITVSPAPFALVSAPPLPVRITPGSWVDFGVQCSPTAAGAVAGNLRLYGTQAAPVTVPLSVTGYSEMGTVSVSVSPSTAGWKIEYPWGGATNRVGNLPAAQTPTGVYTVRWQEVAGYVLPTNQPAVVNVKSGTSAALVGTYRLRQAGALAWRVAQSSVSENGGRAVLEVVRSGGSDGIVTAQYRTQSGTAIGSQDFLDTAGTLTLGDGVTNGTVNIPILSDVVNEGGESLAVVLSSPGGGATLSTPTNSTVTIIDGTGAFRFDSAAYEVDEGGTNVVIGVSRVLGSGGIVSVAFATSNGTAVAGLDYVATNGVLVFGDGQTARTFSVKVLDDALTETDETLQIRLSSPTGGASLGDPSTATLKIIESKDLDQDGLPNWWELQYFGDTTNAVSTADTDGDGLLNQDEYKRGTNPTLWDTDGDRVSDGLEVQRGTDPLRSNSRPFIIITDFDGDGASDLGVYRPENGWWYVRQSLDGQPFSGGPVAWQANAVPVPGDYDGDGLCDFAAFTPQTANWYILQSSTTTLMGGAPFPFGWADTTPVPGDYDGDGKTDLAVYWQAGGAWYIRQSSNGAMMGGGAIAFGWADAMPVPADYDGDGKLDLAVFHRAAGQWYIRQSRNGALLGGGAVAWGWDTNLPVPGDYDGDGRADIAVYDPPSGNWYVQLSSTGATLGGGPINWGAPLAMPAPADYDGDHKTDIAVYVPNTGKWYVRQSASGLLLGGGTDVNGGVNWGHVTVYPYHPAYQVLRRLGLAP
ncbi:MAG: FG-GAP-like repeat-containing protein [Lentisphaerae bacterium]|nr:FG-GAP-like repeat-containing protein [Lentisphaerota bacterium]